MRLILFSADVGDKIGTGHIKRCCVLASKLLGQYEIIFLFHSEVPAKHIDGFLSGKFKYLTYGKTYDFYQLIDSFSMPKMLITDGGKQFYHDKSFQLKIRELGCKLMTITFSAKEYFYSDIVLNQNILALKHDYRCRKGSKLLLGPEYVMLNDSFLKIDGKQKRSNGCYKLFLNFGGADVHDLTNKIFSIVNDYLENITDIELVVGPLYSNIDLLNTNREKSRLKSRLHVNTSNIAEIMNACDFAITSGGMTVWELAFLGKPNVVISSSETEKITAEELDKLGYIDYVGHRDDQDKIRKLIEIMNGLMNNEKMLFKRIAKNKKLVDGKGIERIVNVINTVMLTN